MTTKTLLQLRVHEIARLICIHETLSRRLLPIINTASTMLNHAKRLDELVEDELALRWEEAEEQYRFSKLAIQTLVEFVDGNGQMATVRQMIEKSGRYKSPV